MSGRPYRYISLVIGIAITLMLLLGLASCATKPATRPQQPEPRPVKAAPPRVTVGDRSYAVIDVLYGTDRKRTMATDPEHKFGKERGEKLLYGVCSVSIPRDHRCGAIESPHWWQKPDPSKHVVLLSAPELEEPDFLRLLRQRVQESD